MINYRVTQQATSKSDGFSQVLQEAQNYFADERIAMLGGGIQEILSENVLFSTYKDKLLAGLDAGDAAVLEQLMENTRTHVLSESALAGIQPIASLALPTLRKSWPRVGVQHAIPTEAVKLPKFAISYMTPYILDSNGVKQYLPDALKAGAPSASTIAERETASVDYAVTAAGGGPAAAPLDILSSISGADIAIGDSIDVDASITSVTFDADGTPEVVAVNFALDAKTSTFYGEVSNAGDTQSDTIFGKLDRAAGTVTIAGVTGNVDNVEVTFYASTEMNNSSETVGFDVNLKDVDIPTGAHLTAPLPTEWLQDTMALYQIDGAAKVIDIMSDVLAQKIDLEGINMISVDATANTTYTKGFDCKPATGFSGSPKEWREEVKTVIDHIATKMKNDSFFQNGKFSIMGNGLETQLIPNVNWTFGAGDERGGVEANYGVGSAKGAHSYNIVTTPNVISDGTNGDLFVIFVPSNPDQMTYKFYPYAYSVERNNGYKDPTRQNVPAVLMTRRHVFESFTKLSGKVDVANNDAAGAYA